MSSPTPTELRVTVLAADTRADDVASAVTSQAPCEVTVSTASPDADVERILQTGAVDAVVVDSSVGLPDLAVNADPENVEEAEVVQVTQAIRDVAPGVPVVVLVPKAVEASVQDAVPIDGVLVYPEPGEAQLPSIAAPVWNLVKQQRAAMQVASLNQSISAYEQRVEELETVFSTRLTNAVDEAFASFYNIERWLTEHHLPSETDDATDADDADDADDLPQRPGGLDGLESSLKTLDQLGDDVAKLVECGAPVTDEECRMVSLRDVAESVWEWSMPEEATLTVENNIDVSADRDRLQMFFAELFRNANAHVGDEVAVTIGALPDGEGFYVADDGSGWESEPLGRVLIPGYTSTSGGSGLGLAIVRRIAEAHEWSVRVSEAAEEYTGVDGACLEIIVS